MQLNFDVIKELHKIFSDDFKAQTYAYIMFITEVGEELKPQTPENLNYKLENINKSISDYPNGAIAKWLPLGGNKQQLINNPEKLANVLYNDKYRTPKFKLGNTSPGDGWKYRGRGLIQLTGKSVYAMISKYLNYDFVNNPDMVMDAKYYIPSSVAYMMYYKKPFAAAAAVDNTVKMRSLVNGATKGLARFQDNVKKMFSTVYDAVVNYAKNPNKEGLTKKQ